MKLFTHSFLFTAAFALAGVTASASTIQTSLSAAGVQTPDSSVCSNCYVTFDGLNNGLQNYSAAFGSTGITGTYSNVNVVSADQFGGAGGTGKYAAVGAQSGTTTFSLTLSKPVDYFGLWFSAADSQNRLQFFSGDTLISTYSSDNVQGFSQGCSNPANNPYCGNPNSANRSADSGEAFGYLNFFGQDGTTFDKIVFSNLSTGTGFESDNHAITILNSSTPTSSTTSRSVVPMSGVPEPSTFLLLLGPGAWLVRRHLRKRAVSQS